MNQPKKRSRAFRRSGKKRRVARSIRQLLTRKLTRDKRIRDIVKKRRLKIV